MKLQAGWAACAFLAGGIRAFAADGGEGPKDVRLYALDCGGPMDAKDLSFMSDTGHYDGVSGRLVVTCFLVKHPKGWLLWDTGLGDEYVGHPGAVNGFPVRVAVSLKSQLAQLGLAPKDIAYVAFSHLHFDHTGNANEFPGSTWLVQKAELAWALSSPAPHGVVAKTFSAYKTAKVERLDGDKDVFGDGLVRVLRAPGHTPGHQVLEVKLPTAGTVVVCGDLWHLRESFKLRQVPAINTQRADTLASFDRVEGVLKETRGRLIIGHEPADSAALPRPPKYLQ